MMLSTLVRSRRVLILGAVLFVMLFVLAAEVVAILPRALEAWQPWDYSNYVAMGRALREGQNPYGPHKFYPLPTILWVFVPLSLAPDWFRFVWILCPFVFILILFRARGILFFLFPPLWFVISDAMFDAWLLIPLAWMFANRPILAGLGAALVLFKPHVTAFAVGYLVLHWLITHDWKNLAVFSSTVTVLWLPTFIINPNWVFQMFQVLQTRADYVSILPLLTSSVWSWWWLNDIAKLVCLALLMIAVVLVWRGLRLPANRAAVFQLLGLFVNPVMLASNLITVLPTVRERNEIIALVVVALCAFALDRALGGFGGGYALIPLTALFWQSRASSRN